MGIFKVPISIAVHFMVKGDKELLTKQKTFGDFNIKQDLSYVDDDLIEHKLDIFTPVKGGNGITLLNIHGGAYIYGYKESSKVFVSYFVSKGFTVVSMNYRLANHKENIAIPEQISDVFGVLSFIEKYHLDYKLNPNNLFLMGDSAGGHLALLAGIIFESKEAQSFYKIERLPNVNIKGIALNSPMYDYKEVIKMGRKMLTKRNCYRLFSRNYKNEDYILHNSPRYYFKQRVKMPPLFNASSIHDFFQLQSSILEKDCKDFNYDLEYLLEDSPNKNLGHIYNHFIFENEGKRCNDAMVQFFISHCDKIDNC